MVTKFLLEIKKLDIGKKRIYLSKLQSNQSVINLQDIIPDREIFRLSNQHFEGIEYETYRVDTPIFGDQVEKIIESGFTIFINGSKFVIVNRQLNPSPQKLQENKEFWRSVERLVTERRKSNEPK